MKKTFFSFLITFFLIACDNDKAAEAGSAATASVKSEERKPAESASGCSSFMWFKKGTVLKYDIKGTYTAQTTTTITDVKNDGDALVAEYTTEIENGKKVNSSYRCENGKLYLNLKALFNDIMDGPMMKGVEMEVEDSHLIFPWDMKEGDDLDESVFTLKSKRNGKEFMVMKKVIKNRHVAGSEKITTSAGTFDCLKITETWNMTATMMGQQMLNKDEKTTQWFSPRAGLVKTETHDKDGKLQVATELTYIK
jgi:hypothetical protein